MTSCFPISQRYRREGAELGNWMLQTVAATQLLVAPKLITRYAVFLKIKGNHHTRARAAIRGALVVAVSLCNERPTLRYVPGGEYRDRLHAVGVGSGELPEKLSRRQRPRSQVRTEKDRSQSDSSGRPRCVKPTTLDRRRSGRGPHPRQTYAEPVLNINTYEQAEFSAGSKSRSRRHSCQWGSRRTGGQRLQQQRVWWLQRIRW